MDQMWQASKLSLSCSRPPSSELTPPSTLYHLPDLEEAINRFLGRDPIFMGDLNKDIRRIQNPRNQKVDYLQASFGLLDLLGHSRK